MDDGEEKGPAMGARPKQAKEPNPLNQPRRDREARLKQAEDRAPIHGEQAEAEQAEEAQQLPASKIPPFGDGSRILNDHTTSDLFDDPIYQDKDTCGSVVFTRLLQASYNRGKPMDQHRRLSYKDLAHHIRNHTNKKTSFSFRNMNIPIKHIREVGLHKDDKISGPGVRGVKTTGDFNSKRDATKQMIYDFAETSPFGIVLPDHLELHTVGKEVYNVPGGRSEKLGEHALLIVGKGRTADGVDFLVAQNSWGVEYGNSGYCRISLPENRGFDIFWTSW